MPTERRRFEFSGRVQGVGFRMTARRHADRLGVIGTVRNLPDGRVELVAEADPAILDRLIAALQREFGDSIRNQIETKIDDHAPPFERFDIL